MAVYTHLSCRQIERFGSWFELGKIDRVVGIPAGTINTIYALHTEQGRFVLRILEDRSLRDARYEEALLTHLDAATLAAVPKMRRNRQHGGVISLSSRQHVSVFDWMDGRSLSSDEVEAEHAQQVGVFLAELHQVGHRFRRRRRNRFAPPLIAKTLNRVARFAEGLEDSDARMYVDRLGREFDAFRWPSGVPEGTIHGDLFVDNALFSGRELVGVLDFEMACSGPLIYDLAVALLEWGFPRGDLDRSCAGALLTGYEAIRPLSESERRALPSMCRYIAVRYAATRFFDFEVRSRPEAERIHKDYRHYVAKLDALNKLDATRFFETSTREPAEP